MLNSIFHHAPRSLVVEKRAFGAPSPLRTSLLRKLTTVRRKCSVLSISDAASTSSPSITNEIHNRDLGSAIKSMFEGFNRRDMAAVQALFDEYIIYQNLQNRRVQGRSEVVQFYQDLTRLLPPFTSFVIEDLYVDEAQSKVAVMWHVEVSGLELPWSRGTSIYSFTSSGSLANIRDTPVMPVGLALPALSLAGPAINMARPLLPTSTPDAFLSMTGKTAGANKLQHGQTPDSAASATRQTHSVKRRPHSSAGGVPMRDLVDPLTTVGGIGGDGGVDGEKAGVLDEAIISVSSTNTSTSTIPLSTPLKASAGRHSINTEEKMSSLPQKVSVKDGGASGLITPAAFSGVWFKDFKATDTVAYDGLLDLLGLTGMTRVTAGLIEGIEVTGSPSIEEGRFEVAYLTVIPFFNVSESMRFDRPTSMMRRDLRSGSQNAWAEAVEGGIRVMLEWGEPAAGTCEEVYRLEEGDRISVTASLSVGGRKASAVQYYWRLKNRDEFFRESNKRKQER